MARGPRATSKGRAREIADRYFALDSSGDEPADDSGDDELVGARVSVHGRRPVRPPRPPDPPITQKQARFIEEYCIDFNGTQAAVRAGYSEKTAAAQAYETLRKPHIARAVDQRLKHLSSLAEWDAVAVLKRLQEELTADIADIIDADSGALKAVHDWPLVWRRGLVAGIKTREIFDADGDVVGQVQEVKLSDRVKRLELVGRHVAVQAWREKREIDVPQDSPLAQLARQLEGTGLRPKEIEGTARPVDGT